MDFFEILEDKKEQKTYKQNSANDLGFVFSYNQETGEYFVKNPATYQLHTSKPQREIKPKGKDYRNWSDAILKQAYNYTEKFEEFIISNGLLNKSVALPQNEINNVNVLLGQAIRSEIVAKFLFDNGFDYDNALSRVSVFSFDEMNFVNIFKYLKNPNVKDHCNTPLLFRVKSVDQFEELLRCGANPNAVIGRFLSNDNHEHLKSFALRNNRMAIEGAFRFGLVGLTPEEICLGEQWIPEDAICLRAFIKFFNEQKKDEEIQEKINKEKQNAQVAIDKIFKQAEQSVNER